MATSDPGPDRAREARERAEIEESNRKLIKGLAVITGLASVPIGAYLGSYVGEGIGFVLGNLVELIPYANHLGPWVAERAGIPNSSLVTTEDAYQTSGALGGLKVGGLLAPILVANGYKFIRDL